MILTFRKLKLTFRKVKITFRKLKHGNLDQLAGKLDFTFRKVTTHKNCERDAILNKQFFDSESPSTDFGSKSIAT